MDDSLRKFVEDVARSSRNLLIQEKSRREAVRAIAAPVGSSSTPASSKRPAAQGASTPSSSTSASAAAAPFFSSSSSGTGGSSKPEWVSPLASHSGAMAALADSALLTSPTRAAMATGQPFSSPYVSSNASKHGESSGMLSPGAERQLAFVSSDDGAASSNSSAAGIAQARSALARSAIADNNTNSTAGQGYNRRASMDRRGSVGDTPGLGSSNPMASGGTLRDALSSASDPLRYMQRVGTAVAEAHESLGPMGSPFGSPGGAAGSSNAFLVPRAGAMNFSLSTGTNPPHYYAGPSLSQPSNDMRLESVPSTPAGPMAGSGQQGGFFDHQSVGFSPQPRSTNAFVNAFASPTPPVSAQGRFFSPSSSTFVIPAAQSGGGPSGDRFSAIAAQAVANATATFQAASIAASAASKAGPPAMPMNASASAMDVPQPLISPAPSSAVAFAEDAGQGLSNAMGSNARIPSYSLAAHSTTLYRGPGPQQQQHQQQQQFSAPMLSVSGPEGERAIAGVLKGSAALPPQHRGPAGSGINPQSSQFLEPQAGGLMSAMASPAGGNAAFSFVVPTLDNLQQHHGSIMGAPSVSGLPTAGPLPPQDTPSGYFVRPLQVAPDGMLGSEGPASSSSSSNSHGAAFGLHASPPFPLSSPEIVSPTVMAQVFGDGMTTISGSNVLPAMAPDGRLTEQAFGGMALSASPSGHSLDAAQSLVSVIPPPRPGDIPMALGVVPPPAIDENTFIRGGGAGFIHSRPYKGEEDELAAPAHGLVAGAAQETADNEQARARPEAAAAETATALEQVVDAADKATSYASSSSAFATPGSRLLGRLPVLLTSFGQYVGKDAVQAQEKDSLSAIFGGGTSKEVSLPEEGPGSPVAADGAPATAAVPGPAAGAAPLPPDTAVAAMASVLRKGITETQKFADTAAARQQQRGGAGNVAAGASADGDSNSAESSGLAVDVFRLMRSRRGQGLGMQLPRGYFTPSTSADSLALRLANTARGSAGAGLSVNGVKPPQLPPPAGSSGGAAGTAMGTNRSAGSALGSGRADAAAGSSASAAGFGNAPWDSASPEAVAAAGAFAATLSLSSWDGIVAVPPPPFSFGLDLGGIAVSVYTQLMRTYRRKVISAVDTKRLGRHGIVKESFIDCVKNILTKAHADAVRGTTDKAVAVSSSAPAGGNTVSITAAGTVPPNTAALPPIPGAAAPPLSPGAGGDGATSPSSPSSPKKGDDHPTIRRLEAERKKRERNLARAQKMLKDPKHPLSQALTKTSRDALLSANLSKAALERDELMGVTGGDGKKAGLSLKQILMMAGEAGDDDDEDGGSGSDGAGADSPGGDSAGEEKENDEEEDDSFGLDEEEDDEDEDDEELDDDDEEDDDGDGADDEEGTAGGDGASTSSSPSKKTAKSRPGTAKSRGSVGGRSTFSQFTAFTAGTSASEAARKGKGGKSSTGALDIRAADLEPPNPKLTAKERAAAAAARRETQQRQQKVVDAVNARRLDWGTVILLGNALGIKPDTNEALRDLCYQALQYDANADAYIRSLSHGTAKLGQSTGSILFVGTAEFAAEVERDRQASLANKMGVPGATVSFAPTGVGEGGSGTFDIGGPADNQLATTQRTTGSANASAAQGSPAGKTANRRASFNGGVSNSNNPLSSPYGAAMDLGVDRTADARFQAGLGPMPVPEAPEEPPNAGFMLPTILTGRAGTEDSVKTETDAGVVVDRSVVGSEADVGVLVVPPPADVPGATAALPPMPGSTDGGLAAEGSMGEVRDGYSAIYNGDKIGDIRGHDGMDGHFFDGAGSIAGSASMVSTMDSGAFSPDGRRVGTALGDIPASQMPKGLVDARATGALQPGMSKVAAARARAEASRAPLLTAAEAITGLGAYSVAQRAMADNILPHTHNEAGAGGRRLCAACLVDAARSGAATHSHGNGLGKGTADTMSRLSGMSGDPLAPLLLSDKLYSELLRSPVMNHALSMSRLFWSYRSLRARTIAYRAAQVAKAEAAAFALCTGHLLQTIDVPPHPLVAASQGLLDQDFQEWLAETGQFFSAKPWQDRSPSRLASHALVEARRGALVPTPLDTSRKVWQAMVEEGIVLPSYFTAAGAAGKKNKKSKVKADKKGKDGKSDYGWFGTGLPVKQGKKAAALHSGVAAATVAPSSLSSFERELEQEAEAAIQSRVGVVADLIDSPESVLSRSKAGVPFDSDETYGGINRPSARIPGIGATKDDGAARAGTAGKPSAPGSSAGAARDGDDYGDGDAPVDVAEAAAAQVREQQQRFKADSMGLAGQG